jgi:hypothetical protein
MAKKSKTSPVEELRAAAALRLAASARLLACTTALVRGDLTGAEGEAALAEHRAANRAWTRALRLLDPSQ